MPNDRVQLRPHRRPPAAFVDSCAKTKNLPLEKEIDIRACVIDALGGEAVSEFTTEGTESTEIQIASCWWGREVFGRAVLLQG